MKRKHIELGSNQKLYTYTRNKTGTMLKIAIITNVSLSKHFVGFGYSEKERLFLKTDEGRASLVRCNCYVNAGM